MRTIINFVVAMNDHNMTCACNIFLKINFKLAQYNQLRKKKYILLNFWNFYRIKRANKRSKERTSDEKNEQDFLSRKKIRKEIFNIALTIFLCNFALKMYNLLRFLLEDNYCLSTQLRLRTHKKIWITVKSLRDFKETKHDDRSTLRITSLNIG